MFGSGIITALALSAMVAAAPNKPGKAPSPNYWFSFGDSYTQTWFDYKGPLPNDANPIGNPEYPGWTATGGANWVGFVTTQFNKSLIYTYNYAYGGAVINETLVTPWQPNLIHLTDQVAHFLESAGTKPEETKWTSKNALFSVFIGINDLGNSWWLPGDRDAFSDVLLDNYFELVEKMYVVGGRNFLFVGVPAIERSPLMIAQGPEAQAGEKPVIAGYNAKLKERVANFEKTHRGVKTYFYDSYSHYTEILDNPAKYGFKDATSYGAGADIFWGNDYHPSTYADKLFGERVAEILRHTIW